MNFDKQIKETLDIIKKMRRDIKLERIERFSERLLVEEKHGGKQE